MQPFLLLLSPSHDVKKEKMILGSIFNHGKQMSKYLPRPALLDGEEQTCSIGSDGVIFHLEQPSWVVSQLALGRVDTAP